MLRFGLLSVAAIGFAVPALSQPAAAREGSWCAVVQVGREGLAEDCSFQTFEACWPNVISGNRGFCNQNPRYQAPSTPAPRRAKRPPARP